MVPSIGRTWSRAVGARPELGEGSVGEVLTSDALTSSTRRQMKSVRLLGRNCHWLWHCLAQCTSSLYFFLLVWSYLLWQTSPGDHPSFDNLENDCIGRRKGGRDRGVCVSDLKIDVLCILKCLVYNCYYSRLKFYNKYYGNPLKGIPKI